MENLKPMNESDTDKLINRLQQLPEFEPPSNLIDEVMKRIEPIRPSLWQRLLTYLAMERHIILQPVPLFAAAMLVTGGFWLGRVTDTNRVQPAKKGEQINVAEKALENPQARFLAGRGLMAAGLVEEALPLLQKASLSAPGNPEYAYWEGLCFWANGMPEKERASYIRGVGSSPETIPLLLNLGHNFLEQKEFSAALLQYNKTLSIDPLEQTALYNSGLIYSLQQDSENERETWKTYLQYYRSGTNSFRAVRRLNNLNDFTYRTYQLGYRKIILSQSALLGMQSAKEAHHEVEILAEGLHNDPRLQLDIVFFHENDALTARKNAISLKKHILAVVGEKEKKRVRLSWFGEKETVQTSNGEFLLQESLLLFGRRNITQEKETKI
jgi:tetratricopeptide (TPR) repeat protein